MAKYIPLDALVAEIEKQRNAYISEPSKYKVLSRIISFIDTLEVKEVDFIEKVCDVYCKVCGHYPHTTPVHICRQACDYYKEFKNAMEGE